MYWLQSAELSSVSPNIYLFFAYFFFFLAASNSHLLFSTPFLIGLSKKYHCASVVCGGCGRMIGCVNGIMDLAPSALFSRANGKKDLKRSTCLYSIIGLVVVWWHTKYKCCVNISLKPNMSMMNDPRQSMFLYKSKSISSLLP
jgi:hypothetical protein